MFRKYNSFWLLHVYLNGVFQKYYELNVDVFNNSTLRRAVEIFPIEIKFNSSLKTETIHISFDSNKGLSSKNITLKGANNTIVLNYEGNDDEYNDYLLNIMLHFQLLIFIIYI